MNTKERKYEPVDHKGIRYKNFAAMAESYGLKGACVMSRLARGWDLEKALTTPKNGTLKEIHSKKITIEGIEFASITEACEHYNIRIHTYRDRLRKGMSQEEALTTPVCKGHPGKPCTDHLGNKFSSRKAMLEFWNIDGNEFRKRLAHGWDLRSALETPHVHPVYAAGKTLVDDEGRVFKSIRQMCDFYGVSQKMYYMRLQYGWTKKEALTAPLYKYHQFNLATGAAH